MSGLFSLIGELFHQGGIAVMSSILLVLLITFVIVIERVYRFWFVYDISNTDAFLATVQKMIINNSIENSIRLCKQSKPKLVPFVLSEGLREQMLKN